MVRSSLQRLPRHHLHRRLISHQRRMEIKVYTSKLTFGDCTFLINIEGRVNPRFNHIIIVVDNLAIAWGCVNDSLCFNDTDLNTYEQ